MTSPCRRAGQRIANDNLSKLPRQPSRERREPIALMSCKHRLLAARIRSDENGHCTAIIVVIECG